MRSQPCVNNYGSRGPRTGGQNKERRWSDCSTQQGAFGEPNPWVGRKRCLALLSCRLCANELLPLAPSPVGVSSQIVRRRGERGRRCVRRLRGLRPGACAVACAARGSRSALADRERPEAAPMRQRFASPPRHPSRPGRGEGQGAPLPPPQRPSAGAGARASAALARALRCLGVGDGRPAPARLGGTLGAEVRSLRAPSTAAFPWDRLAIRCDLVSLGAWAQPWRDASCRHFVEQVSVLRLNFLFACGPNMDVPPCGGLLPAPHPTPDGRGVRPRASMDSATFVRTRRPGVGSSGPQCRGPALPLSESERRVGPAVAGPRTRSAQRAWQVLWSEGKGRRVQGGIAPATLRPPRTDCA